jgi:hypothetical protein
MCDKCQLLEKKMERYRRVVASIDDQLTIDRLNELIKDIEVEKAALPLNGRSKATSVAASFMRTADSPMRWRRSMRKRNRQGLARI